MPVSILNRENLAFSINIPPWVPCVMPVCLRQARFHLFIIVFSGYMPKPC